MPKNCQFLDKKLTDVLITKGFSKFICPYGILIIGSPRFPDSYMRYTANVVGHLVDPDGAGTVADPTVRDALDHSWGRIIVGVISAREFEIADSIKGLELHTIKAYSRKKAGVNPRTQGERVINEVVFKFFTRWGWSKAHK